MTPLRGADKIIVGEFQFDRKSFPIQRQRVAVISGGFAFSHGRLLNFLAMLVQPGQEECFQSEAAARARDDIRYDFLIGMAQVWLPIDIINCGCDVETFAHSALTVAKGSGIGNHGKKIPDDARVMYAPRGWALKMRAASGLR